MAETDYTAEIWKTIPAAPDYEASTFGRIRRSSTGISPKSRVVVGRILKPRLSGRRMTYLCVNMTVAGRAKNYNVHRMVGETFLGAAPTPNAHIAHRDGDSLNNAISNLRWATPSENERDKLRHGRDTRGTRNGVNKLTSVDVLAIRESTRPQSAVAAQFGVSQTTVSKIRRRMRWAWL
jgi:hypothetical protein